MPEGPELYLASRFVNRVCTNNIFSGDVVKSAVSTRNPEVLWSKPSYAITSKSRGKEVILTLKSIENGKSDVTTMDILLQFGMSGMFSFGKTQSMHKHAHLNFFTQDKKNVLSFVDPRRFGKWRVSSEWGPARGPCVINESSAFRDNIFQNLDNSAFNKPICEALLNQKFFNGIGNYLRAEILFRAGIAPFVQARTVLERIDVEDRLNDDKCKDRLDLLDLCTKLPTEVTNLDSNPFLLGNGENLKEEAQSSHNEKSDFTNWLQCYYNDNMSKMVDGNKRTIWFSGEAGPMTPKAGRKSRKTKKVGVENADVQVKEESEEPQPKVKRLTRAAVSKMNS